MLNTPSALELIILDKPRGKHMASSNQNEVGGLLPAAGQATRIAPYLAAKSCIRLVSVCGRW